MFSITAECPRCKSTVAPTLHQELYWRGGLEHHGKAQVICDKQFGGCGTKTGWMFGQRTAANAWNDRGDKNGGL